MNKEDINSKKEVEKKEVVKFEMDELKKLCAQEYLKSQNVFGAPLFKR